MGSPGTPNLAISLQRISIFEICPSCEKGGSRDHFRVDVGSISEPCRSLGAIFSYSSGIDFRILLSHATKRTIGPSGVPKKDMAAWGPGPPAPATW